MIARTETARWIEKWAGDVAAGDAIVVEADEVVVAMQAGSLQGVLQPGRHAAAAAGLELLFVKTTPQHGVKAGGAFAAFEKTTGLALRPRAILEYTLRVADPARVALAVAMTDADAIQAWIGKLLIKVLESWVEQHSVMEALSGAWDLGQEATPLANTELEPMGIAVEVVSVTVMLSPDDKDALDAAVEAIARQRLES